MILHSITCFITLYFRELRIDKKCVYACVKVPPIGHYREVFSYFQTER